MILLAHILVALCSLIYTTHLYFRPSRRKFYVSYGLVAATLASGTYLVIGTRAPLVSSCLTGLVYLGVVTGGLLAASRKTTQ